MGSSEEISIASNDCKEHIPSVGALVDLWVADAKEVEVRSWPVIRMKAAANGSFKQFFMASRVGLKPSFGNEQTAKRVFIY